MVKNKCRNCKCIFETQKSRSRPFCKYECSVEYSKTIKPRKCRKCFKIFTPQSNKGKYCSKECGNLGRRKKVKCIVCSKIFIPMEVGNRNRKTCSSECIDKYASFNNTCNEELVEKKCKECGKTYERPERYAQGKSKYCSLSCTNKNVQKNRYGENNPNYRGGYYTKGNFKGDVANRHNRACVNYKKSFLEKNGYLFCEICNINANGTIKHDTHHIYFASRFPKHRELHNFRNLILVCRECHLKFHNGNEYDDVFLRLEKERGLKELFS